MGWEDWNSLEDWGLDDDESNSWGDIFGGGEEPQAAPGETPNEKTLQDWQMEYLRQATAERKALTPYTLTQMGLAGVFDEAGTLTGVTRLSEEDMLANLSTADRAQYENLRLWQDRQNQALRGELSISEGSQQRKMEEWKIFKENMARKGAPVFGTSPEEAVSTNTAGNQALSSFKARWSLIEDQERQGQLGMGESNILGILGYNRGETNANLTASQGYLDRGQGLFGSYSQAYQPYQFGRQLTQQQNQFNQQMEGQESAGLYSGIGNLAGLAAMALL